MTARDDRRAAKRFRHKAWVHYIKASRSAFWATNRRLKAIFMPRLNSELFERT